MGLSSRLLPPALLSKVMGFALLDAFGGGKSWAMLFHDDKAGFTLWDVCVVLLTKRAPRSRPDAVWEKTP